MTKWDLAKWLMEQWLEARKNNDKEYMRIIQDSFNEFDWE